MLENVISFTNTIIVNSYHSNFIYLICSQKIKHRKKYILLNLLLHYTGYQQLTKVSKQDKNKIKTKLDAVLTENVTTQSFVLKHF